MSLKIWKENRKRVVISVTVCLLCLALVAGGIIYVQMQKTQQEEAAQEQVTTEMSGQEMVSASGTTMVGIVEDTYDIDYLDEDLYIEEVFIASGDEIEEGTKVLGFSKGSIETAREQLEEELTTTTLDYRSGAIEYEQSVLEAKKAYQLNLKKGELAQAAYDDGVKKIESNLATLQKTLEEKKELLDEYQTAIESDSYYTEYKVAEKEERFKTIYALYYKKLNEWGLVDNYDDGTLVTIQSSQSKTTSGNSVVTGESTSDKITQMNNLMKMVEQYESDYEQAVEEYETAKKDAQADIEQVQVDVEAATLSLNKAQLTKEAELIALKAEYEAAVAESSAAQTTYNTAVKKLDETLESLENEKEEANDNLTHFEELVGDGYFLASNNGTIFVVNCEEATDLTADTMVLAYSNPDTITVTVSVDQSDIAKLAIGGSATVVVSEYGTFESKITEINPTTSSTSKSSITYNVVVTLEGEVNELEANLTAQVVFEVEEDSASEESVQTKSSLSEKKITETAGGQSE